MLLSCDSICVSEATTEISIEHSDLPSSRYIFIQDLNLFLVAVVMMSILA